jgi:Icc-related predicted phosphoesterase
MIPNDTDVLITHGPPAGFLDQSKPGKSGHLGCDDLKEAIYRVEPELHLFGHIHGSGGMKKTYVGDTGHKTILANCAILDEQYLVKNKPMEIEI